MCRGNAEYCDCYDKSVWPDTLPEDWEVTWEQASLKSCRVLHILGRDANPCIVELVVFVSLLLFSNF
jgi:hypothetical protein